MAFLHAKLTLTGNFGSRLLRIQGPLASSLKVKYLKFGYSFKKVFFHKKRFSTVRVVYCKLEKVKRFFDKETHKFHGHDINKNIKRLNELLDNAHKYKITCFNSVSAGVRVCM